MKKSQRIENLLIIGLMVMGFVTWLSLCVNHTGNFKLRKACWNAGIEKIDNNVIPR